MKHYHCRQCECGCNRIIEEMAENAQKPKVTIVSAVWNLYNKGRAEFFEQMMESVNAQTYENLEHIIVYTNSTDATSELVDKYVQKGWARAVLEPGQGLWHAMNKGIEEADGEFIEFMNSDDFFIRNDAVELIIEKIMSANADWGYACSHIVAKENTKAIYQNLRISDWREIYLGKCPCHQTVFMKTNLLREMGGFKICPKHPNSMSDDISMMTLLIDGRVPAIVDEYVVKYRMGGASSNDASHSEVYAEFIMEKFAKKWGLKRNFLSKTHYSPTKLLNPLDFFLFRSQIKKIQISEWQNYMNEKYGLQALTGLFIKKFFKTCRWLLKINRN